MKVLFITPHYEPAWAYGGVVKTTAEWAHAYAAAAPSASVDVFTTTAGGDVELDVIANTPVKIGNITVTYFSRHPWMRRRYVSLKMFSALISNLAKYDLVHIVGLWTFGNVIAGRICRLYKIPYVVSVHGLLMPWALRHRKLRKQIFLHLVERAMLKRADGVMCSTDMEKRHYLSLNINDNAIVISNISALPDIDKGSSRDYFRRKYNLNDSTVMLFSGRIVENKGLHLTIAAFANIAKNNPEARLIVMGPEEGDFLKKVKEQIKTLNLDDKVTLLGMLTGNDYWNAMAGADLFVLNSYSENFGLVVAEALSVGLPVLISDQVGICDMVRRYDAGYVTTLDVDDIAEKMKEMINQPQMCKEMGLRGMQLVRDHYTPQRVGTQLSIVFEQIVKAHKIIQQRDE